MRSSTGAAQPGILSSTRSAAYVASARIPGSWANRHPYNYILKAFLGIVFWVRVGTATGLVIIGEPIGSGDSRQQTAVGETPNRAARLQSLAGPAQVVIDAATKRQIGGLFVCQDLGTLALKGVAESVQAWQVLSAGTAEGRFEALHGTITPLVGRDEELELLLRR